MRFHKTIYLDRKSSKIYDTLNLYSIIHKKAVANLSMHVSDIHTVYDDKKETVGKRLVFSLLMSEQETENLFIGMEGFERLKAIDLMALFVFSKQKFKM
jgi:hypothetical protein